MLVVSMCITISMCGHCKLPLVSNLSVTNSDL